jgi:hypothetical protein
VPTDSVPRLFARLVDDTAVSAGGGPLAEAFAAYRAHRAAWYRGLVGPLILPSSALASLAATPDSDERLTVGVLSDNGPDGLARFVQAADGRMEIAHVEAAVAKRGQDPQPGLRELLALLSGRARSGAGEVGGGAAGDSGLRSIPGYAEIPLTWGLLAALDTLAEARAGGLPVAAKFRTGGLAAELFPTPVELAAVICACRDRDLRFKLTAGLHHAVRYTDPETGFVHHGFLNVLVATLAAARGAEVAEVAEILAATDPVPLVEPARALRDEGRPLWDGFGSSDLTGPVTDLRQLGLLTI